MIGAGSPFPEQRATFRLRSYWLTLRRSESGPFFVDFRPDRNPIPWDQCCLASWSDSGLSLEHFGSAYRTVFSLAASVHIVDPGSRFFLLFGDIAAARTAARPLEREGSDDQGHRTILYRSIFLPFVDLQRSPRYVLGAFTHAEHDLDSTVRRRSDVRQIYIPHNRNA
jgi:hypothetical protein